MTVIDLPASICCQCLAEKPTEIMSSWLNPRPQSPAFPDLSNPFAKPGKEFRLICHLSVVKFHAQKHHEQISWPQLGFGLLEDGDDRGGSFSRGRNIRRQPSPSTMLAKLLFRHRLMMGCQPNLVGVVPFLPLLLSSVQHMRALVEAEILRSSQAASGSSY